MPAAPAAACRARSLTATARVHALACPGSATAGRQRRTPTRRRAHCACSQRNSPMAVGTWGRSTATRRAARRAACRCTVRGGSTRSASSSTGGESTRLGMGALSARARVRPGAALGRSGHMGMSMGRHKPQMGVGMGAREQPTIHPSSHPSIRPPTHPPIQPSSQACAWLHAVFAGDGTRMVVTL